MGNKKIAVLIDSDNTPHSKLKLIVEELSSFGQIVVKRAYGDFSQEQLKNWKTPLNELAIQPYQQFAYTTGKNATDSLMIIDAMDLLYSERFDTFALVSSDSDFTSLANRLRASEIQVIGVGKQTTPAPFRNACDNFVAIENLEPTAKPNGSSQEQTKEMQQQLWQLMHQSWQHSRDDSGWAKLGEIGRYVKQFKPDFDARNYGITKLSDFFDHYSDRYQTRTRKGHGMEVKLMIKNKKLIA